MKASLFFKDRAGSLAGLFFVLVLEALFLWWICGSSFSKEEDIITG